MDWMTRLSPRGRARVAGVFEFLEGNASSQGQVFLLGRLIVTGDAAASADQSSDISQPGCTTSAAGRSCRTIRSSSHNPEPGAPLHRVGVRRT